MFIVCTGNLLNRYQLPVTQSYAISLSYPVAMSENVPNTADHSKHEIAKGKSSKKTLRTQLKKLRKAYRESTKGEKIFYIALVILGAAILGYGVFALSCSLSCSGSEALAYIVGIVGLAAIVFGAVKLIQRITRGKRTKD